MPEVIPLDDLKFSPTARLFEGGDRIPVSMFVVTYEQGKKVDQHTHPYAEVFLVETGEAEFEVAGETQRVPAGNFVIVPPETPHGFANPATETLRVVSVHPSPNVIQKNL
jgi:quercetin dioxygenase-like cupin family protein